MKILFILCIDQSFGEREHALNLARQCVAGGAKVRFVIPHSLGSYFQSFKMPVSTIGTSEEMVRQIEVEDYDVAVCCEYFNLPKDVSTAVLSSGKIVVTVDGTTMGVEINTRPVPGLINRHLEVPESLMRLRPCPIAFGINSPNVRYWDLFYGGNRPATNPTRLTSITGLSGGDMFGFLAIAPWAWETARKLGYDSHYTMLLKNLLNALPAKYSLILVCPNELSVPPNYAHRIVKLPYLQYDDYQLVLLNSSIVFSDNVIQTSMSKAFMMDIPCLFLGQSTVTPDSIVPYSFNIFPLSLKLPEENRYLQSIDFANYLNPDDISKKIKLLLKGESRDRTGEYIRMVKSLPSGWQVLQSLV